MKYNVVRLLEFASNICWLSTQVYEHLSNNRGEIVLKTGLDRTSILQKIWK
jgi:hypothetical protein